MQSIDILRGIDGAGNDLFGGRANFGNGSLHENTMHEGIAIEPCDQA